LGIIAASRALALLRGRDYVVPQDVLEVIPDVLRHRLVLSYDALADEVTPEDVITRVLQTVGLPQVAPQAVGGQPGPMQQQIPHQQQGPNQPQGFGPGGPQGPYQGQPQGQGLHAPGQFPGNGAGQGGPQAASHQPPAPSLQKPTENPSAAGSQQQ
jgi:MoxR-like ATPase